MEKIINFPTRVQYTKEYLTKNPRVKQRQGIAQRLTRGHEAVVTIEWEGVKSIGHVHLDFLEEVLPATTITMEKNTQLPVEVTEEIIYQAEEKAEAFFKNLQAEFPEGDFSNQIAQQIGFRKGHRASATEYATKLQEVQQENAELRRQNAKLKQQATGWRPLLEDILNHDYISEDLIQKITKFLYGE